MFVHLIQLKELLQSGGRAPLSNNFKSKLMKKQ